MNDDQDQHRQDLVDSLLQSMYETDKEQSRSLVSAGMELLDECNIDLGPEPQPKTIRLFSRWLTLGLAVAAMLVIAVALPMFDNSNSAMAAVKLSLEQAFHDVGRHYSAKAVWRLPELGHTVGEADLYVKGGDKFAVRFGGPLQEVAYFWIGSNETHSWVVPPVGPVLEGDRRHLTSWFDERDDVSTPYLHITTALEKLSNLYELQILPDDDLEMNGKSHRCQRVNGTLARESTFSSPDRIDLWVDADSGVALKIVASWDLAEDQFGRESATIMLQEEKELSDDFFTSEVHGGEGRHRISFATE